MPPTQPRMTLSNRLMRCLMETLTSATTVARARAQVDAFEVARARGEDRALFEGLWLEVPTWRNAKRLLERAVQLADAHRGG